MITIKIFNRYVSYNNLLEERFLDNVNTIIIHCTELPTLNDAFEYAERKNNKTMIGNCCHYYVDRDGGIYRFVANKRIAYHAVNYNSTSIGIELINLGRYPNYYSSKHQQPIEEYPNAQILSLQYLLRNLHETIVTIKYIKRHSDIDKRIVQSSDEPTKSVRRKIDPGPLFPWTKTVKYWNNLINQIKV